MKKKNLARDGGMPYYNPLTKPEEDQKRHDEIVEADKATSAPEKSEAPQQ